ncbi:glycosyltransferase [Paraflavitalea sp. CAU 1676]|uniref:glycosyltransferase n=1 Tax=Paraflavitalea sp. CAU 1676 TaxID=3032598 RepID=UPI0023DA59AA|nr:glycosyltransferase [Paraflavitalea sp. CAU 1676]MDF2190890.1 glycosyltransferase [Paraflavitalea sp. CAU 1676]
MPIFLLVFFLLMVGYAILINFYHRAWNQLPVYKVADRKPVTNISVVVAARNEEDNLPALLDSLNSQQYPSSLYEVIVVNDHSTDNTWSILQQAAYPELKLRPINLAAYLEDTGTTRSYKKKAIETGIREARGTLIVTTDADCRLGDQWLQTFASFYETTEAKFIAAPVRIDARRSLLGIFQTLDFITLQGITGASVYKRFHSMCNGANLAYEKKAFEEVNGFEGIDKIPSGDDMLLMHKIYQKYPDKVFYLKAQEAIASTAPAASWKAFFHQRIRWASKADSYDDKRIFWTLLLVYLMNVCFLVAAVAAFWKNIWLFFCLLLLLAKVLIEFPFVHSAAIFFGQTSMMKYFPFLQPLHILYTIIAGWLGKFGKYEWKGRVISKQPNN